MIHFDTQDTTLLAAIREVLREIPNSETIELTVTLNQIENGLSLRLSDRGCTIGYSDRRSLMRAVGLLAQHHAKTELSLTEEPRFETLGMMADVSRNAVMKVDAVKKLARLSALEGFNAFMLYTEDTYELKEYPYFGHLRGRYTAEELREIDDYCELLGIELIPCIQTLAHLNAIFEWPAFASYNDCHDILLAEDERVYELIDCMLRTMSENVRSRKINVGLDEAHMLGVGAYLDRNGYHTRTEIMLRHVAKVTELCKKYGYQPRMWSDMFFRMLNHGQYRVPGTEIPPEVARQVPDEMTLVYWDYRQPKKENYDEMFRQHRAFSNPIAFAGGDCSWYGIVPLSHVSYNASRSAMTSCIENGVKEVYCTMWKDDGAACSFFSALPVLYIYGEFCWCGGVSEEHLRDRMRGTVGLSFDDLLSLDDVNALPGRERVGIVECNPNKYVFYENILTGKFDANIPDGSAAHFAKQAAHLHACAERAGEYAYLYESIAALCDCLAIKAELGKELYEAYHAGDRALLSEIAEERIETVKTLAEEFRLRFREQWMRENKSFGFDIMDVRIGGLLSQLDTAQYLLGEYLSGRIERIEELEAERLPFHCGSSTPLDGDVIMLNHWMKMAGQNMR